MKFVYKPEGLEPKEWEFEPNKLMSPECIAIEKLTGLTFTEWAAAVKRGSVQCVHAYLWVMLKRENPTLTPKQVQFSLEEYDFEPSDDEIRLLLTKYAETPEHEREDVWDEDDLANIARVQAQYPHLVPQPDAEEVAEAFGPDSLDDEPAEVAAGPKDLS